MRRCISCQSPVRPGDHFCARCGTPQPREATPEGVQPRWTLELNHARWCSAHPQGRVVLAGLEAGARDRLSGYAQDSGELIWSFPAEDAGTEPLLADRTGFLVASGDRVLRYDAESGDVVWATSLEGRGVPMVRQRPDSPVSLLVTRAGAGLHEMRAWTLDVLTGRAREVADHLALEVVARRRLGGLGATDSPDFLPRVGADAWACEGRALFTVAVVREAPATTGAARSAGLVLEVDVLTREPAVMTTRAAGMPLGPGQVHYTDTDEGQVLVWAASDGLIVLPLDDRLDPVRFEVPGLVRLVAVSGRQGYVEVRSAAIGTTSLLAVTLPFGKPVWQNPADAPCAMLGLDASGRSVFARARTASSVYEFRPRDHGFRRTYRLPDELTDETRGRERVEPGPVSLVSAGRVLLVAQVRERGRSLAAFPREADGPAPPPVHRNHTTSM